MNLTSELDSRIIRARAWLDTVSDGGSYREWLDIGESEEPEGPLTLIATGYALHLFSWLFAMTGQDEDRRDARMSAEYISGIVDEGAMEDWRFFEMGIAGRAMYAASKAFKRVEFWDVSIYLSSLMTRKEAQEEIAGGFQRKAALIWKLLNRISDYDDLDGVYFRPEYPDELMKEATAADSLHALACSCEALALGMASRLRAQRDYEALRHRLFKGSTLRADVLSQYIRLHLLQGHSLVMGDVTRLFEFQHKSGGFHERIDKKKPSSRLSTIATIFAIQAMYMAGNVEACKIPALLGRTELLIV